MSVAFLSAETGFDWNMLWNTLWSWLTTTGVKIVIALLVLFVSFKIINFVGRKIDKKLQKDEKKFDKTLTRTLIYAGKLVLKILVVICLIAFLGIDTSGFTALIASLGVCVGLAVNGVLSNLAGGVLILFTRPFRIDDYIDALGYSGTVENIKVCTTVIKTPDNKIVHLPNGALSTATIVNYSQKDLRRVDLTFSVSYSDDFEKAKELILQLCNNHQKVLKDPAPFVRVNEHASSSINIVTRVWVNNADYWDVHFDLMEQVKKAFDENGIEIPFEQVDVHVKSEALAK